MDSNMLICIGPGTKKVYTPEPVPLGNIQSQRTNYRELTTARTKLGKTMKTKQTLKKGKKHLEELRNTLGKTREN